MKVTEKQSWRYISLLLEALYQNVLFQVWAGSCSESIMAVHGGIRTAELWPRQVERVGRLWVEYPWARAAITKHHRTGGLNNGNWLSYGSGSQKSKIKWQQEFVPGLSPWLADVWLSSHGTIWNGLCPSTAFVFKALNSHVTLVGD